MGIISFFEEFELEMMFLGPLRRERGYREERERVSLYGNVLFTFQFVSKGFLFLSLPRKTLTEVSVNFVFF